MRFFPPDSRSWPTLVAAVFCTQCATSGVSRLPKQASRLSGETQYLSEYAEPEKAKPPTEIPATPPKASFSVVVTKAKPPTEVSAAPPKALSSVVITSSTSAEKIRPKSIQQSITAKKRLAYAQPEGAGRLAVDFGLGELELDLDPMILFFKSDNVVVRQLKKASSAGETIRTCFIGTKGHYDETCVITSLRMVLPHSTGPTNEGLYHAIWDYLDHGADLVACRMEKGSDNPKVDIARFKRRYPADPGLYDDGQVLMVDGQVMAARIIEHGCRDLSPNVCD